MQTVYEKLGRKIRKLRLALGLSQEELASYSGVHRTYIGSVERGERNISLQNIVAIAKALSVSSSELLLEIE